MAEKDDQNPDELDDRIGELAAKDVDQGDDPEDGAGDADEAEQEDEWERE